MTHLLSSHVIWGREDMFEIVCWFVVLEIVLHGKLFLAKQQREIA